MNIRTFDPAKRRREVVEVEEQQVSYEPGQRLSVWKNRTVTVVEEELPPPRSSVLPFMVVSSAVFAICFVSLVFLLRMGTDPQASGSALAKVILALGSALGAGGVLGAAAKLWRRKNGK